MARTIQFKRNHNAAVSASEAKQRITNMASDLANGEMVLGTYSDAKAVNGIATIAAFKTNDKLFFVDNQTILNKLGILDDGSEDANAGSGSFIKKIESSNELINNIIQAAGLNADGTYTAPTGDKFLSGATSLNDAASKLSTEVKSVEDFIGMSEESSGKSIVEEIEELSGITEDLANDIDAVSAFTGVLSGVTDELDDKIEALSGVTETLDGEIDALSAKTVTNVEDTDTVDFTIETAEDGTNKIKADVKISAANGNILSATSDGIYTQVDYNAVTNSLVINGVEKALNAGSIIDSITYDSTTEELVITYHTSSSSEPVVVRVSLVDLIEEYDFVAKDNAHNVGFTVTRSVSGATTVQADVNLIDCGEY
jgi:hypothetical protein